MVLRDNSFLMEIISITFRLNAARLSKPSYLNNLPGCEYKEAEYGGDFSDMKGGIKLFANWGSIGLVKDNIIWETIIMDPTLYPEELLLSHDFIELKTCFLVWNWNYIHGWLC